MVKYTVRAPTKNFSKFLKIFVSGPEKFSRVLGIQWWKWFLKIRNFNHWKSSSKNYVPMDAYFRRQFSMVKTSNSQKPFSPYDSSLSKERSWPGYKNLKNNSKHIFTIPFWNIRFLILSQTAIVKTYGHFSYRVSGGT